MESELTNYLDQSVVIDTKSQYIYIGTLASEGKEYLTLKNVDVHDHDDAKVSKELYIMESAKYGVKTNRKEVKVLKKETISISLLENVIIF